jgi:hypothetical protein
MDASTVGKKYFEADKAYFAGFLDADGAVMAIIEKHQEKKYGFRVRVILKITQRSELNLNWFQNTFHVGLIRKNRGTYDWIVRNQKDVYDLLQIVKPFCKAKSRQVEIALEILEKRVLVREDLLTIALLADTLSKFNVRSTNRRKNYASKVQEYFSCND